MLHYNIISTGDLTGLIEVVNDAETIASIQSQQGGISKAFDKKYLLDWLRQQNQETSSPLRGSDPLKRVRWNFVRSVAAYSVATYVLGIGDRHNDNIMLTRGGRLL